MLKVKVMVKKSCKKCKSTKKYAVYTNGKEDVSPKYCAYCGNKFQE